MPGKMKARLIPDLIRPRGGCGGWCVGGGHNGGVFSRAVEGCISGGSVGGVSRLASSSSSSYSSFTLPGFRSIGGVGGYGTGRGRRGVGGVICQKMAHLGLNSSWPTLNSVGSFSWLAISRSSPNPNTNERPTPLSRPTLPPTLPNPAFCARAANG